MNDLPQWLITAISSVIAAVITFFATRRLTTATVAEKDANTAQIMTSVAGGLAKQLKAVEAEVPGWKKSIADAIARAEHAEAAATNNKLIGAEAARIVEELSHMTYMRTVEEEETPVERRFKTVKLAAHRIGQLLEGE